jgi:hypothetical protein
MVRAPLMMVGCALEGDAGENDDYSVETSAVLDPCFGSYVIERASGDDHLARAARECPVQEPQLRAPGRGATEARAQLMSPSWR